jgi:MFS family permease
VTANSMFNLTFTVSQLVGIVLLAPWVIKFFGASALFIVTAAIYLVAGVLTSFLPPGVEPERSLRSLPLGSLVRVAQDEIAEAWGFISGDRRTWWGMVFVTLASTLTLILAMLAPRYVVVEAGIQPEDAVFLFAPAGLGILVMTLVMTRLARRFGELALSYAGGFICAAALLGMAGLPRIEPAIEWLARTQLGAYLLLPGQQIIVPPLMLVSALIGVGFALANIPSQTILMARAPVQTRGRIFSVLLMMTNVAAIAPLAFLGALADLFGVANVIGVVGLVTLAITFAGIREREATLPPPSPEPAPLRREQMTAP